MNSPLIEYHLISLYPTCVGNERIRLEADGRLYWAKNSRECDEGQLWSAEWQYQGRVGGDVLASEIKKIRTSGLIDLPEMMIDPSAEDGKREELVFFIDGLVYCRTLENIAHPAFSDVVRFLRGVMMEFMVSSS